MWISGGQEEFFREVPSLLSPFFSLLTASCSSSVLPNISQTPSFGISLPLGFKTVLDPDTFEFGVQDERHVVTRVTNLRF